MFDCMLPLLVAVRLQVVWAMPPEFHVRLLCALCNDVVNCYNMKAEIAGRCGMCCVLCCSSLHSRCCLLPLACPTCAPAASSTTASGCRSQGNDTGWVTR